VPTRQSVRQSCRCATSRPRVAARDRLRPQTSARKARANISAMAKHKTTLFLDEDCCGRTAAAAGFGRDESEVIEAHFAATLGTFLRSFTFCSSASSSGRAVSPLRAQTCSTTSSPGLRPKHSSTRMVRDFEISSGRYTLWVAPTKRGGFCAVLRTHARNGGGRLPREPHPHSAHRGEEVTSAMSLATASAVSSSLRCARPTMGVERQTLGRNVA
jgi:hypothetical protein